MLPAKLERWKSQQIAAAIERGINPLDAANAMRDFLATLPPGADPTTYVAPAYALEQMLASEPVIADARGAWYGSVDAKEARLLDATED